MAFIVENIIKKGDLQRDWTIMKRMASGDRTSTNPQDHAWLDSSAFLDQRKIQRHYPSSDKQLAKMPAIKSSLSLGYPMMRTAG